MSKHVFDKTMRKQIHSYLKEGFEIDDLNYYLCLRIGEDYYPSMKELPPRARKELCVMEAKAYLKRIPDASKKEKRMVMKHAKKGQSVYWHVPSSYCFPNDMISYMRFLKTMKKRRFERGIALSNHVL